MAWRSWLRGSLGEAVRVVVVGADVGGFACLLGLADLTDFLFPVRENDREEQVNEWNEIPSSAELRERR